MTTKEAGTKLNYSTSHIRSLIRHGLLKATKNGFNWKIDEQSVKDFKHPHRWDKRRQKERKLTTGWIDFETYKKQCETSEIISGILTK